MWDVHANGGVLIMVGLGERAILRCERGRNCQFCYKTHWGLGVLGVLQIFSGYAVCTCGLDIMWDVHANGRVLIIVGFRERADSKGKRG